jgi:hypothetical protein
VFFKTIYFFSKNGKIIIIEKNVKIRMFIIEMYLIRVRHRSETVNE